MKNFSKKFGMEKITAILSAVFFLTSCMLPVSAFSEEASPQQPASLPYEKTLGSLEIHPAANSTQPSVIFIQDAHANYEAQKSIRDILKEIVPALKTKNILVEGTSAGLDPEVFRLTASPKLDQKIASRLAKKGLVNGAELFMFEPESQGVQFLGLEDEALYEKEREAFKAVITQKRETTRAIGMLDSRLEALKARIFNSSLKDLDRKFTAYEKGRLAILGWFDSLRKLVSEELGFSLNDPTQIKTYPNLVRLAASVEASKHLDAVKLKAEKTKLIRKMSGKKEVVSFVKALGTDEAGQDTIANERQAYALYQESQKQGPAVDWLEFPEIRKATAALLLSGDLVGEGLFREMEHIKELLYTHLARTENEKKAVALDKNLRLMKDLLSLESTREVWNTIKAQKNEISPRAWVASFQALEAASGSAQTIPSSAIDTAQKAYQNAISFYQMAGEREAIFMNRIQSALADESGAASIVIGGGFHTEGLKAACSQEQLNLLVIQPTLMGTKSDLRNYYQAVFETASLPFTTSKMAPRSASDKRVTSNPFSRANAFVDENGRVLAPEQPGVAFAIQRIIARKIIEDINAGLIQVTPEDIEALRRNPLFRVIGARVEQLPANRFQLVFGAVPTTGVQVPEGVSVPETNRVAARIPAQAADASVRQPKVPVASGDVTAVTVGPSARVSVPSTNVPEPVAPDAPPVVTAEKIAPAVSGRALDATPESVPSVSPITALPASPVSPSQVSGVPSAVSSTPNIPSANENVPFEKVDRIAGLAALPDALLNNPRIPSARPISGAGTVVTYVAPDAVNDITFIEILTALPSAKQPAAAQERIVAEIITSPSELVTLWTSTGTITMSAQAQAVSAVEAYLARIQNPEVRKELADLIHEARAQRAIVQVGLSESEGPTSLANPAFRRELAKSLEENENLLARYVHEGTPEEIAEIEQFFSKFGERFQVIQAAPSNWDTQMLSLLDESLLKAVKGVKAGEQIESLEQLFDDGHVVVILDQARWDSSHGLPMGKLVKVRSAVRDESLRSKWSTDPALGTKVAGSELLLAELWALLREKIKDVRNYFPDGMLSFSSEEDMVGFDTAALGSTSSQDIENMIRAVAILAYQA